MASPVACSTKGETYCLTFRYLIELNARADLSVTLKSLQGSVKSESKVWTVSSSGGWNDAEVPVTTDSNYSVVIAAKRRFTQIEYDYSVFVDRIQFVQSPCLIYPPAAVPTLTSTESTPKRSTPTSTIIVATTATETTTTERLEPNPTHNVDGDSKPTTVLNNDLDESSESPNVVDVVAGAVAAVIIVIAFSGVVSLVFLRRRHLLFWRI